jgi:hypothetical protein
MGKVEHGTQEEYIKGWTNTMIDIWKEKIVKYSIIDSGNLMSSVTGSSSQDSALLKFVSYGIYQAYGVGNGYKHDNGGNLEFLDPEYRKKHKLGKPRKRRNWYTPRLYSSVMVMQRAMAEIYSHDIVNTICDALTDGRAALK